MYIIFIYMYLYIYMHICTYVCVVDSVVDPKGFLRFCQRSHAILLTYPDGCTDFIQPCIAKPRPQTRIYIYVHVCVHIDLYI